MTHVLSKSDRSYLDWPFFDQRHRDLQLQLDA